MLASRHLTGSRRAFLETSATALAAFLTPVDAALAHGFAARANERKVGIVPFVDDGAFPTGTSIGAGLGQRRALDLQALTPGTLVTGSEQFFIRTGAPEDLPAASTWTVNITGLVAKPQHLGIADLQRKAVPQGTHLLECAGNSVGARFGFISAARFTGVPLDSILEPARPQGAMRVLVSGYDEHAALDAGSTAGASWIFSRDELRRAKAFLATTMNGEPLSRDHGAPLRLVMPGWYACTAIKWVNAIELVADDAPATSQMREYAGRTHQPTNSRDRALIASGRRPEGPQFAKDFEPATIDPAAVAVRVDVMRSTAGSVSYRITGVQWGGRIPNGALRIRFTPEAKFEAVDTVDRSPEAPWTLWSHTFKPKTLGRYQIALAIRAPGLRTRRLDLGYYTRTIEIPTR